jgi:hypothetical protein
LSVAIGIAIAIVGAIIVASLNIARKRMLTAWRAWRAKRFWAPLVETEARVILGRLHDPEMEPSGLVGIGDVRALASLNHRWGELHVAQWPVLSGNQAAGLALGKFTLVVLGGPDMNRVHEELAEALSFRWVITHDPVAGNIVVDTQSQKRYKPTYGDSGELLTDYGIIVCAKNPFASPPNATRVYVFAGCFGFGTQAAVTHAASTVGEQTLRLVRAVDMCPLAQS